MKEVWQNKYEEEYLNNYLDYYFITLLRSNNA
jgi:hypothetical protein